MRQQPQGDHPPPRATLSLREPHCHSIELSQSLTLKNPHWLIRVRDLPKQIDSLQFKGQRIRLYYNYETLEEDRLTQALQGERSGIHTPKLAALRDPSSPVFLCSKVVGSGEGKWPKKKPSVPECTCAKAQPQPCLAEAWVWSCPSELPWPRGTWIALGAEGHAQRGQRMPGCPEEPGLSAGVPTPQHHLH